jgi:hypothetical protein
VSFLGKLKLNRVQNPDVMPENGIKVASLIDVGATKVATIQQRGLTRDYEDILARAINGVSLSEMLAATEAVYGSTFDGALSLKALTGTLREIRTVLRYFSEKGFDAVLNDPYPGIFDRRSWVYWNGRYHHEPVPELPKRKIQ